MSSLEKGKWKADADRPPSPSKFPSLGSPSKDGSSDQKQHGVGQNSNSFNGGGLVKREESPVKPPVTSSAVVPAAVLTSVLPPLATGSGTKFVPLWKQALATSPVPNIGTSGKEVHE